MSLIEQAQPSERAKEQGFIPGVPELVGEAMPAPELIGSTESGTRETMQNDDGSVKHDDSALSQVHIPAPQQPSTAQQQSISGSLQATDGDKIEADWIKLAKEVIRQTNGDPYTKQKRINTLQSEYLKKRHNIDIKVDE